MTSALGVEREQTLFCPFPAAINSHAVWVQHDTTAWAQQYGLLRSAHEVQRFEGWLYGILIARAYPTASQAIVSLIADWNTWLFLLDDTFDESPLGHDPATLRTFCTQVIALLHDSTHPLEADASGALRAFKDIVTRMAYHTDAALRMRLIECLEKSFQASVWEATNRANQRVPPEGEYLHYRQYTSAVYCFLNFIELAQQIQLSDEVRQHATVRDLTTMTNNLICWSNDIFSYEKEHAHGNMHNLVAIRQHAYLCSKQEAVASIIELHNETVDAFQRACATVPSFGDMDAAVQSYVSGLRWWIRANMDWSTLSTRYREYQHG